jgi:hypothetical protein
VGQNVVDIKVLWKRHYMLKIDIDFTCVNGVEFEVQMRRLNRSTCQGTENLITDSLPSSGNATPIPLLSFSIARRLHLSQGDALIGLIGQRI